MFFFTKNSFIVYFLLFFNIAFSQYLRIPYYEPFENESFSNFWQIQEQENGRIRIEKTNDYYSNSLDITVEGNDHPAMAVTTDGRTRTEIALLNHHIENNDEFFYSWDLFIPTNQDFTKFSTSANENYYVIMQWHETGEGVPTYCLKGNDIRTARAFPLTLRLVPNSLDKDLNMDLHLKYGTTYGPGNSSDDGDICPQDPHSKGYREYIIDKAIKMGEWNHIVMQIKWSIEGDAAYIRMWINDLPIINDKNIEQYKRKGANPDLYVGRENVEASKLGGVPLLYTRLQNGVEIVEQNYQKLGHYRKNYNSENTIIVDNYRITTEYPPMPFTTSLTDKFCNKELPLGQNYMLEAYEISPSNYYSFNFENESTHQSNEMKNTRNFIDLLDQNWVRANESYKVSVRALNQANNGNGFDYGKSCVVKVPETTSLENGYAAQSLSSPYMARKNESIYTYLLPGTTDYLFKVVNVKDPKNIVWIPSNGKEINSLNLSRVSGIKENETYQVSVKVGRMENDKDVYSDLSTGKSGYIISKKIQKKLNRRIQLDLTSDELHIKSKSKLKNIYLIRKTGEILSKSSENEKEVILNILPYKNEFYQIVVIDKKRNVFSVFSNSEAL